MGCVLLSATQQLISMRNDYEIMAAVPLTLTISSNRQSYGRIDARGIIVLEWFKSKRKT